MFSKKVKVCLFYVMVFKVVSQSPRSWSDLGDSPFRWAKGLKWKLWSTWRKKRQGNGPSSPVAVFDGNHVVANRPVEHIHPFFGTASFRAVSRVGRIVVHLAADPDVLNLRCYVSKSKKGMKRLPDDLSPKTSARAFQVLLRKVWDNPTSHRDTRQAACGVRGGFAMVLGVLLPGVRQLGLVFPVSLRADDFRPGEIGARPLFYLFFCLPCARKHSLHHFSFFFSFFISFLPGVVQKSFWKRKNSARRHAFVGRRRRTSYWDRDCVLQIFRRTGTNGVHAIYPSLWSEPKFLPVHEASERTPKVAVVPLKGSVQRWRTPLYLMCTCTHSATKHARFLFFFFAICCVFRICESYVCLFLPSDPLDIFSFVLECHYRFFFFQHTSPLVAFQHPSPLVARVCHSVWSPLSSQFVSRLGFVLRARMHRIYLFSGITSSDV